MRKKGKGKMAFKSIFGAYFAIVLAVIFNSANVQAAIIFDNFDLDGGFHPEFNLVAADARDDFLGSSSTRLAAQFTVTGDDYNLSSITLPISFQGSGPNDTLRVRLTEDTAGTPGTTLEVLSENQAIWSPFSNPFTTTTTINSAINPLLSEGSSYWIITELTSFVESGQFVDYRWSLNTTGTTVPFLQQQKVGGGLPSDPWTGSSGNFHLAFRVEGNVVPIPAAVWLFGSGLIGLVGLARRKA